MPYFLIYLYIKEFGLLLALPDYTSCKIFHFSYFNIFISSPVFFSTNFIPWFPHPIPCLLLSLHCLCTVCILPLFILFHIIIPQQKFLHSLSIFAYKHFYFSCTSLLSKNFPQSTSPSNFFKALYNLPWHNFVPHPYSPHCISVHHPCVFLFPSPHDNLSSLVSGTLYLVQFLASLWILNPAVTVLLLYNLALLSLTVQLYSPRSSA